MKKKVQSIIAAAIYECLPNVHIECPILLAFTWYEPNKKRDKDNVAFAKKFIFDALVESHVIPNDGWKKH